MHETGLAASILDIAEREAHRHGSSRILLVRLKLGRFTGVVRESLEFAFEALRPGTLAEDAVLDIEPVPLAAKCPACQWSGEPVREFCFICPCCNAPLEILSGREMQVAFIELEERQEAACNVS
ncbi:MAG: hydrogenase maturation nickel metallochaperone HypA [Bryobacterales bacterium]|nr:hydrogenase maturation nickel metallochaperone HypA [Bryobacterales bacterium]